MTPVDDATLADMERWYGPLGRDGNEDPGVLEAIAELRAHRLAASRRAWRRVPVPVTAEWLAGEIASAKAAGCVVWVAWDFHRAGKIGGAMTPDISTRHGRVELAAMLAAATPGPWALGYTNTVALCHGVGAVVEFHGPLRSHNAALVRVAVDALPAAIRLAEERDELAAEVARLRAAPCGHEAYRRFAEGEPSEGVPYYPQPGDAK